MFIQPEGFIPGKPLFYATAMSLGGIATGLLAKSNEGRPTKDRRQSRTSGKSRRNGCFGASLDFDDV